MEWPLGMGGRYSASLDWQCCWWRVSSRTHVGQMLKPDNAWEQTAAGCREGGQKAEALWQAAVESEGFSYSLIVKIKLLMGKYGQEDPNISPGVWGRIGAEKAIAHCGIPALLPCLLSPPLPKALVVLLSHSGTADSERSMVSVLRTARKSVKTFWWKCRKSSQRQKCQVPSAVALLMLWQHLQLLWVHVSLHMNTQGLSSIQT